MGAAAPVFDELDGPRVLHAFGALAVDLQDLVANLGWGRGERKRRRKGRDTHRRMGGREQIEGVINQGGGRDVKRGRGRRDRVTEGRSRRGRTKTKSGYTLNLSR